MTARQWSLFGFFLIVAVSVGVICCLRATGTLTTVRWLTNEHTGGRSSTRRQSTSSSLFGGKLNGITSRDRAGFKPLRTDDVDGVAITTDESDNDDTLWQSRS